MDLRLTEDEEAVRSAFATLFEKEAERRGSTSGAEEAFDKKLWQLLVSLDSLGIANQAEDGSIVCLALLAREAGRHLAPVPIIEGAVALRALAAAPQASDLAADVTAGRVIATVALEPVRDGIARHVVAGGIADVVLALDGDDFVALQSEPRRGETGDLGFLAMADRAVDAGSRTVLATGEVARQIFEDVRGWWRVATAAGLVGLGDQAIRIGVDYAKVRHQFGVPIGTFQAVQHGLADAATDVEGAELLLMEAAWEADQGSPTWQARAAMAYAQAGEAAQTAASVSLHYHGGYGVALEYAIHRYVRRAKGWTLAGGDPDTLWERIGRQFLETAGGQ
ncbi:acyl-CoA dehydrogenase family protein [Rhodococcus koreensis]|uniref:Acyl-CoA dehydrogenase, C-terminal domain n=1 Tax=Rhodococcus koreensis TaxID=99653 RepID=A0A1H4KXL2_9NOCA|nr:acyl-CoA dehydrogenase family protein [Rhodococcus koreensis]SEB63231.1 Acyl-CoA dehydrogenase, C-terminal domain [Rhodococcus koreensis]